MSAILLVDDDVPALGILATLLLRHTCLVAFATSAREAVAAAKRFEFDFVLAAAQLPDATGKQLQRRFQKDAALRRIPFLFMMGGQSDAGDFTRARGLVAPLARNSLVYRRIVSPQPGGGPPRLLALESIPRN